MRSTILLFLLAANTGLTGQIITTVAGNGKIGYSGDGGPAINAQLGDMYYTYPAFDNLGNMYIAQDGNNTIRKIDVGGTITTIAGKNGVMGYTGDGGPAINALLYHPTSIAVDNSNNIYFVDRNADIIRKIDPSGIITTVSGQATTACGTGDGGSLALARFWAISAITFDQFNNLYISDYACNTIRKVSPSGIITTVAGNGTWGYSGDGGPATQARLAYPGKVAVDNAGNIYIPDGQNNRIRKVSTNGIITTIAGTGIRGYSGDGGPALNANISISGSVVIDNTGNLYFGDYNHVIRKIDGAGTITAYGGNGIYGYSGDGGPALLASIALTEGKISIFNNNIYFVNYQAGNVIRKISNCLGSVISQQPADVTLCASGNASFSITAANTTGYQWQVNSGAGWSDLSDNSMYSGARTGKLLVSGATVSANNFQYRCVLSSPCGLLMSGTGLLQVISPASPSITVSTPSTSICAGASALFTAAVQNGGNAPSYQWKKNGTNVGSNSSSYSDNSPADKDIISCTLTAGAGCCTGNTASSNSIVIAVTMPVAPTVAVSTSSNNICSGTQVTFTSSITNGGSSPTFTWSRNNVNLFLNAPTYTDNSLKDGDLITCSVTSSLSCVTSATATSLPVKISVIPLLSPAVTITSSANSVCRNTLVRFTASPVNGGNNPIYQWKKNGLPVGSNSIDYTDDNLNSQDLICCTLIPGSNCVTAAQATSNVLRINIHPDPVVSLDKTNTLCEGSPRLLDAGAFAGYLWNTGSTERAISINNTGLYSVIVTDINGCTGTDFSNISAILPSPRKFLPGDTSICPFGSLVLQPGPAFRTYLWNTGSINPALTITHPGKYWLKVEGDNGCYGSDTIMVYPKDCLKGFFMPTAFSPNNDGKNDLIKPILLGNVKQFLFRIYNRWGQLIFQSSDPSRGWNGTDKGSRQDANVFVWICTYQFDNEPVQHKKGTFVLVR